ncbi:MAG: M23 family metallopeptidase [Roseivirga sp.]|nr:M23 family metallopeptidase [Roseivirga sp.]
MKKWLIALLSVLLLTCKSSDEGLSSQPAIEFSCSPQDFNYTEQAGCDGQIYPDPVSSPYVLPYAVGEAFKTGLVNCSFSYHASGQPDQYAFDFDMPEGTPFTAARAGKVRWVIDGASSTGGGAGNYLLIDHGDNTFGYYLHSPQNGISITVGQEVEQGDVLGITGRSGLAGYPHLHFIVVKGQPDYPYESVPVSFKNAIPSDVVLKTAVTYTACNH